MNARPRERDIEVLASKPLNFFSSLPLHSFFNISNAWSSLSIIIVVVIGSGDIFRHVGLATHVGDTRSRAHARGVDNFSFLVTLSPALTPEGVGEGEAGVCTGEGGSEHCHSAAAGDTLKEKGKKECYWSKIVNQRERERETFSIEKFRWSGGRFFLRDSRRYISRNGMKFYVVRETNGADPNDTKRLSSSIDVTETSFSTFLSRLILTFAMTLPTHDVTSDHVVLKDF